MGGSASSGDFLAALADHEGTVPIRVHRDYDVPSWWTDQSLVLATSHSGTTEETVSATEQILKRGGVVIVIASGGELAGFSELYSTCFLVPIVGGQPPRTAFGHIFSRQYACLQRLGIMNMKSEQELNEIFDRLEDVSQNFDFTLDPEGDIAQLAAAMTSAYIHSWTNRMWPSSPSFQKSTQRKFSKICKNRTHPRNESQRNCRLGWRWRT